MSQTETADIHRPGFWDPIHRENEQPGWEIGEPAPPLARAVALHARAGDRCVVPGCGSGQDLLPPLRAWCLVTGVDWSPTAIDRAAARVTAAGLRADLICQDLFGFMARRPGNFDLAIEHTCFCALQPARRDAYVNAMADALKPGGLLLALFYAEPLAESGPPWGCSADEIRERFGARFEIVALDVPPDSIERRAGRELLGVLRRT